MQENDLIGVGQVPAETLRKLIVDLEEGQILEQKVRMTWMHASISGMHPYLAWHNKIIMVYT